MIILAIVCKWAYCCWCPMLLDLKKNNLEVVITSEKHQLFPICRSSAMSMDCYNVFVLRIWYPFIQGIKYPSPLWNELSPFQ